MAACAPATVPVYIPADRRAEHAEIVEEAAALLYLGVDWRDESYGAIKMSLHYPSTGRVCGEWLVREGCRRALWACPDPYTVAHEIGHVLGLEHADGQDNLMNASPDPLSGLSDAQTQALSRGAARLTACQR